MKYAFATTSIAALLLAMPALAQSPAANSADPASPANSAAADNASTNNPNANNTSGNNASGATAQAPAAGSGPQIIVKQPPPVITVQPHAPNVTVTPGKPDVAVQQALPKVDVTTPQPNVSVDAGKPDVKVLPAEKPDVAVKAPAGNSNATVTTAPTGTAPKQPNDNATASSGSTTPPAAGAASVAPTAGVFPMATDAKSMIGKNVYDANGTKVGEVNNLLVGADGRVHAAVVEFGGFLGIGENKVAVSWDQLNITQDRITTAMTEDQIKAAPRWDKNRPGQFAEYQPLNK
jgi:sporulation protein YlmC with PRC-barrel domain